MCIRDRTSIGDNTLSKHADCTLRVATREKLYSKIGSFSSTGSITFLLDILYSCVFSKNYQKNLEYKINISKYYDQRQSPNKVIEENWAFLQANTDKVVQVH